MNRNLPEMPMKNDKQRVRGSTRPPATVADQASDLIGRRARYDKQWAMHAVTIAVALALTGCAVGPRYDAPPAIDIPVAFKEGGGEWVAAAPADGVDRGA